MKVQIETDQVITKLTQKIINKVNEVKKMKLIPDCKYIGIDDKKNIYIHLSISDDTANRLSTEEEFLKVLEGKR